MATNTSIVSWDRQTRQIMQNVEKNTARIARALEEQNHPKDVEEKQSNLVDHARRELELIGEDPETIAGYLKVVRAFADMGHSGGSAMVAIPVLHRLFQFKNLSELTDDPDEWIYHGEDVSGAEGGVWQSKRWSEAFSNDGGKTYYLLSEGGNDKNREPLHKSKKVHG